MEFSNFAETTYSDLLSVNRTIKPDEFTKVVEKFPVRIPSYYFSLINSCDENDPVLKMCVPSVHELSQDGIDDTSGEGENTIVEGLQHKYKQTALILSTNQCAMYCRYCFRRRLVGKDREVEVVADFDKVMEYVASHKEISNVLISGGDSFILSNAKIKAYLHSLCSMDHLHCIRFGTKMPIVYPMRISEDSELLEILAQHSKIKQIYVVTQYNHSNEITPESIRAIKKLQEVGVIVKNQSVLLNGVNDCAEVLSELLGNLTKLGIIPYYIFQCRPVTGIKNQFQVPIKKAIEIIDNARAMQNGNGKCFRYIISNQDGKIEIVGVDSQDSVVFKFHQAKNVKNQNKIFTRILDDDTCWIE